MRKLLLLMLLTAPLKAQISGVMIFEKGITYTGTLIDKIDQMKGSIKEIDGKTWVCLPAPGTYYVGEKVRIIDGVVIPVDDKGKARAKKINLIQIDFKTRKKLLVKGGNASQVWGYERALKKMEKADGRPAPRDPRTADTGK